MGVYVVNDSHWSAGLALQYDLNERPQRDDARLKGMGDAWMTPRAKLFAQYTLSAFSVAAFAA
ncbi:outer membrane scaffolding protein for murein synthesis (MipA/OmpV family) [Paraburkholderia sp. CI3]